MEKYLGIDMAISNQDFNVKPSGDISAVSGRSCLAQDLLHALTTPRGSLLWHPDYGMDVYKFLKMPGTPINKLQLQQEIKRTVEADPRVEIGSTQVTIAEWDMNKICCKVSTQPISEGHRLNLVLGYGMYDISGEVVTDELA